VRGARSDAGLLQFERVAAVVREGGQRGVLVGYGGFECRDAGVQAGCVGDGLRHETQLLRSQGGKWRRKRGRGRRLRGRGRAGGRRRARGGSWGAERAWRGGGACGRARGLLAFDLLLVGLDLELEQLPVEGVGLDKLFFAAIDARAELRGLLLGAVAARLPVAKVLVELQDIESRVLVRLGGRRSA
jgi:hypothetical protein